MAKVLLREICKHTRIALAEHHLAGCDGVVLHAVRQLEQLLLRQREQHGDLAQRLKAPHVLDWPQQCIKLLAPQ